MKFSKACNSISPKTTFYHNNGLGRDTYISFNSGGVLAKQIPSQADNSSGRLSNKQRYGYKISNPVKTIHYLPDGTGRDVYIINDEGGFSQIPQYSSSKGFNYLTSLRTYQRYPSSFVTRTSMNNTASNRDFFVESQSRLPAQEQLKQLKLHKVQQQLIQRLQGPMRNTTHNTQGGAMFGSRGEGAGQPYIMTPDDNGSSKYKQFTKIMNHNLKSPTQQPCKKYISSNGYSSTSKLPKVISSQQQQ